MASSSYSFAVISMAVLLQLLLVSASSVTSTKYINAVCKHVSDKSFCVKTLNAYPPAASASGKIPVAKAVLRLGISYAYKTESFIKNSANKKPNLNKQFEECLGAFGTIIGSLKSAVGELKISPDTANYDVMICTDSTTRVKNLIGTYSDKASKNVMKMTLMMEKLIAISVGATEAVGG